jgi:hypothetical protein
LPISIPTLRRGRRMVSGVASLCLLFRHFLCLACLLLKRLACAWEGSDARRRGPQGSRGGVWTGAWTRATLPARVASLLEATCGQFHAALVYSAGRDHARHYPLSPAFPFLQLSSSRPFSLDLSPFLVHAANPHFPQAVTNPARSDRSTPSMAFRATQPGSACSSTPTSSSG